MNIPKIKAFLRENPHLFAGLQVTRMSDAEIQTYVTEINALYDTLPEGEEKEYIRAVKESFQGFV